MSDLSPQWAFVAVEVAKRGVRFGKVTVSLENGQPTYILGIEEGIKVPSRWDAEIQRPS